jgi:hypothetical protein
VSVIAGLGLTSQVRQRRFMSTLLLDDSSQFSPPLSANACAHACAITLHDWLQGSWALLFSNPDDFAPHASTPPGFMACLADELRRAHTKPLVLANRLQQGTRINWLQHATDDRSVIVLRGTGTGQIIDFSTRALVLKLKCLPPPFVLILDDHGLCRSTISYRPRRIDRLRTVQDLLSVVAALRNAGNPTSTLQRSIGLSAATHTR